MKKGARGRVCLIIDVDNSLFVCFYLIADLFQMVTSVFPILLNSVIKSNGVCVCVCTHVPKHVCVCLGGGRAHPDYFISMNVKRALCRLVHSPVI